MDLHREDTDVDIGCDDFTETSSDMSSDDGEISREYWDNCYSSDDDIATDFDDIDEVNNAPHSDDRNNIHISLMFIMLWASLYGVSAKNFLLVTC